MAGINNLGNNLKLQRTQQLKATAQVDTQNNKGKEVGDAKPAAVWITNLNKNGPIGNDEFNLKLGDVEIVIDGDNVYYRRLTLNAQGEEVLVMITADDVQDRDYEKDRGDIRS